MATMQRGARAGPAGPAAPLPPLRPALPHLLDVAAGPLPLLMLLQLLLLLGPTDALLGTTAAPPGALQPSQLGVAHVKLAGVVRSGGAQDAVLLHVFLAADVQSGATSVRGYLFAEPVSSYTFSQWGHSSQPQSVQTWRFPVTLKDVASGTSARVNASTELWDRQTPLDLQYPVPFLANFSSRVECVQVLVQDWLHTAEICLPQGESPLDKLIHGYHRLRASEQQQQQHQQLGQEQHSEAVWSVLTPYRNYGNLGDFIAVLIHYVTYHVHVGFSGTLLYASPYLARVLLEDVGILRLLERGELLILQWEAFNNFQEVASEQTVYYAIPEQMVIINHALLTFSRYANAVLFMADIDEFLVPMDPIRDVHGMLRTPTCWPGKEDGETRPWGAIQMTRFNFCSQAQLGIGGDKPGGAESALWRATQPSLDCSPLHLYKRSTEQRPSGVKALLRPAGGVHSWHVHVGVLERDHALYVARHDCAFILHAVNLWSERVDISNFSQKRGKWRSGVLPSNHTVDEYIKLCLPSGTARNAGAEMR